MLTLPSKEDMEAEKAKEEQAKADAKAPKPEEDSTCTGKLGYIEVIISEH